MRHQIFSFFLLCTTALSTPLTQAQTVLEGKGRFVDSNPVKIRVWLNDAHFGAAPKAIVLQIPAINASPLKKEASVTLADPKKP